MAAAHISRPGQHVLTATGVCPLLQFAAEKYGAAEIVDPRPFLVGSMLWTYKKVGYAVDMPCHGAGIVSGLIVRRLGWQPANTDQSTCCMG